MGEVCFVRLMGPKSRCLWLGVDSGMGFRKASWILLLSQETALLGKAVLFSTDANSWQCSQTKWRAVMWSLFWRQLSPRDMPFTVSCWYPRFQDPIDAKILKSLLQNSVEFAYKKTSCSLWAISRWLTVPVNVACVVCNCYTLLLRELQ